MSDWCCITNSGGKRFSASGSPGGNCAQRSGQVKVNRTARAVILSFIEFSIYYRGSRERGTRPSRSLCSASRRTGGAADSAHRLLRQGECCQFVGGTPTGAVETTALPIFN